MAYSKAGEERKWRKWKEQEEEKLRELGVKEDIIESLRQFDWEMFKSERRYKERRVLDNNLIEQEADKEQEQDICDMQQLLDSVDNQQLLHILLSADKKTLQVILLEMMGYSMSEICSQIGLNKKTIYTRLGRLKKKIKNIL